MKRAPIGDGAHSSVVGGSTAGLRRKCPASRVEEQGAPNNGGEAADKGTALHHVVEASINDSLGDKSVLRQFSGNEHFQDGMSAPVIITADMLNAKALPALEFFDQHVPETADFWLEKKVRFTLADGLPATELEMLRDIEGAHGTADVIFDDSHASGRAGIIDWKFGDGWMVPAEDNDQMRFYLVGAIMRGFLPVQATYEATIFQPAASLQPEQYASTGVYTWEDLADFNADLAEAITGPVTYAPGEHCKFCKGKLGCAAFNAMKTKALETDVPGMTPADLAKAKTLVPAMRAWIRDIEAAAYRHATGGGELPGWKLEPAEGDREWSDEEVAFGALARLGVPLEERRKQVVMSAPAALAWLRKNGTDAKTVDRFERRHVKRPNKGEKLVQAKDGEPTHANFEKAVQAVAKLQVRLSGQA